MKSERDYIKQIKELENKVTDMNVVIETLQQALARAEVSLGFTDKDYVFNHSAKWASKWTLKDYDYNI